MKTLSFTPICKLGTTKDSPEIVAKAFATVYWDTPRQITCFELLSEPLSASFQLVNGYRTYRIAWDDTDKTYLISVSGL